jgi:hypothetical protein
MFGSIERAMPLGKRHHIQMSGIVIVFHARSVRESAHA